MQILDQNGQIPPPTKSTNQVTAYAFTGSSGLFKLPILAARKINITVDNNQVVVKDFANSETVLSCGLRHLSFGQNINNANTNTPQAVQFILKAPDSFLRIRFSNPARSSFLWFLPPVLFLGIYGVFRLFFGINLHAGFVIAAVALSFVFIVRRLQQKELGSPEYKKLIDLLRVHGVTPEPILDPEAGNVKPVFGKHVAANLLAWVIVLVVTPLFIFLLGAIPIIFMVGDGEYLSPDVNKFAILSYSTTTLVALPVAIRAFKYMKRTFAKADDDSLEVFYETGQTEDKQKN